MALLNFDTVLQNLITVLILVGVFWFIYSSMKEGKIKQAIKNLFEKMKEREEK